MLLMLLIAGLSDGPISKYRADQVKADYVSSRAIGDIERCVIDLDGRFAPNVYRQPDRPTEVTFLWNAGSGVTVGRVDLQATASGTRVKAWAFEKQVRACAPS